MKKAVTIVGAWLLVLFCLAPFLWTVLTAVKSPSQVMSIPPTYVPTSLSFRNFETVFDQGPFVRALANSVIVALGSTLVCLAAGSLAAYGLARLKLKGARWIEYGLLFFALFPPAVLVVPMYSMARLLSAHNSYTALILAHAALNLPFAIWILTSFFRQFPVELEEAARVDGFSRLELLVKIVLPVSAPALAATAILVFIFSWNEFVIALTLMSQKEMRTVPLAISMLSGSSIHEIPWGAISAAVVMTTLPVVAAVLAFQRWILSGLTAGSVKG